MARSGTKPPSICMWQAIAMRKARARFLWANEWPAWGRREEAKGMWRTLAGALTLAVVLSGMQNTVLSAPAQVRSGGALATTLRAMAIVQDDTGGGVVRKGPLVVQVTEPAITEAIPAAADIFLAGRSFPFRVHGRDGVDIGGRNSPPLISIKVAAGHTITITTKF